MTFISVRTFRTAGEGKDILVVGRVEEWTKVMPTPIPTGTTATYDSEDGGAACRGQVGGETINLDVDKQISA